jgi:hypothetical protein
MSLRRIRVLLPLIVLCIIPATFAGVVVETEIRVGGSDTVSGVETFYAQGEMIRSDPDRSEGGDMSMIFRDQTMWFVDHGKKECNKIDKEALAELTGMIAEMMKQLEQVPPQQREMMEKMMRGRMPGMAAPVEQRYEKGETIQVGEFNCTLHSLFSDGEKVSETCVADESVAGDLREAMGAFRAMSRFTEDLQKMASQLPFAEAMQTAFSKMAELEGFPVRMRWFDRNGTVVRESTLKAVTRKDLDAELFEIPKGYKTKDLMKGIQRSGR